MNLEICRQQFLETLIALDQDRGKQIIEDALAAKLPAEEIIAHVVNPAMDDVSARQTNLDITLSRMYIMARIVETALNRLLLAVPRPPVPRATVVIGTARGDYHGLGRRLVATFMRVAGFKVVDLGLSVENRQFVNMAVSVKAQAILASALLVHTAEELVGIRDILRERKLENEIKFIVGGAPFNFDPEFWTQVRADAMARNATDAVATVRQLIGVG
ncbi:MAG: cobalamin B12-binding domain-containing protein [Chloroflexi bacterium]|nr:cobalamin B12-binding domain-containing protein [Chloroflexota bacterium]